MKQQQINNRMDRRAALLDVFDGMNEAGQANAVLALEALARVAARRTPFTPRLLTSSPGRETGSDGE
jgi:hypothetical protein